MKIPKLLLIKGHEWSVEYKWSLKDDDGERVLGLCDKENRTIYLDKLISKEEKWEVFHHEVGHAIVFEAHMNENGGIEGIVEEAIVSAYQDFYTNNFVMKWKRKS